MKKLLSITIIIFLLTNQTLALLLPEERAILTLWDNTCENVQEKDIPTILIPWILASWYSSEWYGESNVKRWIPDPITHAYDPLIYTFKKNWYSIKDVFYKDEFTLSLDWSNPKWWLYVWWYDWKKDNKISATLLTQLIWLILKDYEAQNKCNIWKVNIVAHSMWWLVARAMLEDMCAWYNKLNDWSFDIPSFPRWDNYVANWILPKIQSVPCINPYSSKTILKNIKVNKLVTIATPQRWSPKAFPIWEKWDIEMTDWFWVWYIGIKQQLDVNTDGWLYKLIHWYDNKIPNWIVSIWQLLPDVVDDTNYNNIKIWYLLKNYPKETTITENYTQKYFVPSENYPSNSFLEELNKKKNIEKMFDKIEGEYLLYYSTITWNKDENNILDFELWNKSTLFSTTIDNTYNHKWQDIYDKYNSNIWNDYYLIKDILRDNSWLWWDWTVPSNNLRLVPNDTTDWQEIVNNKFQSLPIDCSQNIYNWFWTNTTYEACAHSIMPFTTSAKVIDFIAWTNTTNYERVSLINNFWYASYIYKKIENTLLFSRESLYWIKNYSPLSIFFDDKYYTKKFDNVTNWKYSLDLPSSTEKLTSLALYDILSPIDILITDEQGRRIGIDRDTGMIINEIPGAWTSWRAWESGEREFFLIPIKEWEKINHKIETTSTWDWEYHIVMNKYDENWDTESGSVVIAWNAKLWLSEDYEVVSTSSWWTYTDLNANLPLTLDVTKELRTSKDNLEVRYNVKWQDREKVDSIRWKILKNVISSEVEKSVKEINSEQYNSNVTSTEQIPPLQSEWQNVVEWQVLLSWQEKIDWILEIALKEVWKYDLILELLDGNDKVLKTEHISIEKTWVQDKKINENILNSVFYNNIDLKLFKNSAWEVITNYDIKVDNKNEQKIEIIQADWEKLIFDLSKDFKYKAEEKSDLEILNAWNMHIILWEKNKKYIYNLKDSRIEKVEVSNWSVLQDFDLKYNQEWKISSIKSDKNTITFNYDKYTWKLDKIGDLYNNIIEINYNLDDGENIKVNNENIDSEKLLRLDLDVSFLLKHKSNLNKTKLKLESQKLDNKAIQKLINSLEKSKQKYLKMTKDDLTKKEIEYLVLEIQKILNSLLN